MKFVSTPTNAMEWTVALSPVLIVEDNAATQLRLRRILLNSGAEDDQIFSTANIAQARAILGQQFFRLALIDIGLPDGSGVSLIQHLQEAQPDLAAVVVSAWGTEDIVLAALRAGAIGYLLKEREDEEILRSLRTIQQGGAPIDPFIAKRILHLLAQAPAAIPGHIPEPQPKLVSQPILSRRETELLNLVAKGLSNREIADLMFISRLTVECHTKNIYKKLAVSSRTEAVYQARLHGWLA